MHCQNCNHLNQGGKFCENCGTNLSAVASSMTEQAQVMNSQPQSSITSQYPQGNLNQYSKTAHVASNQYFETTKSVSKQYVRYFLNVLKKPYASSHSIDGEYFTNGIITMCLYALLIPLMFYFSLKGFLSDIGNFGGGLFRNTVESISPPFTDVVLKPFFAYLVFILLLVVFSFIAIKLGKIQAGFKEVSARFGSFLIPFVAVLLLAVVFSLLKIGFISFFLLFIGFIGAVFLVPPLVITSFKQGSTKGLDTIYGALVSYILTFITLVIMGNMLFEAIKSAIGDLFNPLGF